MLRRHLTPSQWHQCSTADRLEMMAFDLLENERRAQLLRQIQDVPGDTSILAQIIILLD